MRKRNEKFQNTCGFTPGGITLQECLDACNMKRNGVMTDVTMKHVKVNVKVVVQLIVNGNKILLRTVNVKLLYQAKNKRI